ncbi:MAG: glycoside hydrolase family 99-like domain-containing protein [Prevotella sp.]|nr:glycoside hydrolase family 99-like domain-containing protein [Prevotella sp.]
MKLIAFYLPQFHTIPENDEWWGKDFTDWTNVKAAKPLFSGHEQPKAPLNDNYYDLANAETLRWQAALANQYGVYGMCFYHYWFDGKLLLEKPAELLLADKSIDMRFCFSWANEPWSRTWDGKANVVLIGQSYGKEEDWKAHFNYLLPFFKDERYIKIDGRPVFVIYKSQSIEDLPAMLALWEEMAKAEGLPGLHFVNTLRERKTDKRILPFRNQVEFEPARTNYNRSVVYRNYHRLRRRAIALKNKILGTQTPLNKPQSFSSIASRSLALRSPRGTFGGVFMGWDNTPRRGLNSTIILPPTKEAFKDYLRKKMRITREKYMTDFLFLNAWNEWAEGTMLEPDKQRKYCYLEAIKEVMEEEK